MIELPDMMTTREVAEKLRLSRRQVGRLCAVGILASVKLISPDARLLRVTQRSRRRIYAHSVLRYLGVSESKPSHPSGLSASAMAALNATRVRVGLQPLP